MPSRSNCVGWHKTYFSMHVCIVYMSCFFTAASQKWTDVDSEAGGDASSSIYQQVYISAVEHPQHFWMQVLSDRSTQLDSLTVEMTTFYETQVRHRQSDTLCCAILMAAIEL